MKGCLTRTIIFQTMGVAKGITRFYFLHISLNFSDTTLYFFFKFAFSFSTRSIKKKQSKKHHFHYCKYLPLSLDIQKKFVPNKVAQRVKVGRVWQTIVFVDYSWKIVRTPFLGKVMGMIRCIVFTEHLVAVFSIYWQNLSI